MEVKIKSIIVEGSHFIATVVYLDKKIEVYSQTYKVGNDEPIKDILPRIKDDFESYKKRQKKLVEMQKQYVDKAIDLNEVPTVEEKKNDLGDKKERAIKAREKQLEANMVVAVDSKQ